MSTIEDEFAQVSPLLDDAIQQIDRMEISPQERAAVMALLMTHVSTIARKRMIDASFARVPVNVETAEKIAEMLMRACVESDAEVHQHEQLYAVEGTMQ